MRGFILITCFMVAFLFVYSCRKKDNPSAGKGGSANLTFIPQHHGRSKNFTWMTIYIKYNTKDAPGNGVYDDSVHCTVSSATDTAWSGTFTGLKDGDYYAYGYGYDSSVYQNVKGGGPYTITNQQSITSYLPVSED